MTGGLPYYICFVMKTNKVVYEAPATENVELRSEAGILSGSSTDVLLNVILLEEEWDA